MGFRLNRTYVLDFEGTALEGAVVKIRATSIAVMIQLREADSDDVLAGLLCEHVVEWNLDDEKGEPLAVTPDAVLGGLERPVLQKICVEWYRAAAGVTAPLDAPSTSTDVSLEGSMPMEALSPNL
jgi:hypothetical protein